MALYRRYRPSQFRDVVGQDAVVAALSAALDKDVLPHAMILHGPRGCGKTSLARIIARGLNCAATDGPTSEPCGDCDPCRSVLSGSDPDVIEMDAASNRGVDDARALRERVFVAPIHRARVFVLDEAHMLTREAQSALLKIIEEPPSRTYFILATTAPEKILDTISSRCARYRLRLGSIDGLASALRRVCAAEGVRCTDEQLSAIAEAADGSYRDALSLLEQAITGEAVDDLTLTALTGGSMTAGWLAVLSAAASADTARTVSALASLWSSHDDAEPVLRSLSHLLRALIHQQAAREIPDDAKVAAHHVQQIDTLAQSFSLADLLSVTGALNNALLAHAAHLPWQLILEEGVLRMVVPIAAPSPGGRPVSSPPAAATPAPPELAEKEEVVLANAPRTSTRTVAAQLADALPAIMLVLRSERPEAYLQMRLLAAHADGDVLVLVSPQPVRQAARRALARIFSALAGHSVPAVRWQALARTEEASAVTLADEPSSAPSGSDDAAGLDEAMADLGFQAV